MEQFITEAREDLEKEWPSIIDNMLEHDVPLKDSVRRFLTIKLSSAFHQGYDLAKEELKEGWKEANQSAYDRGREAGRQQTITQPTNKEI